MHATPRRWITAASLVLSTGLSAGTIAHAAVATTAAPSTNVAATCSRTLTSYPVLHPGDRGPAVRSLQCLLNDNKVGPVVVDGIYGPQTKRAMAKVEATFEGPTANPGLVEAGIWTLLHARTMSTRTLTVGSTGADVVKLQRALRAAGGAAGGALAVDGVFGKQTKSHVVAFQRDNDMKGDGIVGPKTRWLLQMGTIYHGD